MDPELDRQMAAQRAQDDAEFQRRKAEEDAAYARKKAEDDAAFAKRQADDQMAQQQRPQAEQANNNIVKDTMGIVGLMTGAALIHELSGVQSLGAVNGNPGADQGNGVASNGVISTLASMFGFNTGNADPSAPQLQASKPNNQPTLA